MILNARKLRHRVTIQERILTQDSNLDPVFAWQDIKNADMWADIAPLSVKDFLAAQSMQSQIVARITIRYRDDLNAQMRLKHGVKCYAPAGFLPDADSGREYLTIPVTALASDDG